jgi:multidrug efflux pump subunit AcrA (membrane-fusion protein)
MILNDQVRNVATVPIQAIFDDGGTKYCYRLVGKEFKKVKVILGKQNEDLAEIRSGLKIGDKVSLVKPSLEDVG